MILKIETDYQGTLRVSPECGAQIKELIEERITGSLANFCASRCGISPTNVYPFLNGKATIKRDNLVKILEEINCNIQCTLLIEIAEGVSFSLNQDERLSVVEGELITEDTENPQLLPQRQRPITLTRNLDTEPQE